MSARWFSLLALALLFGGSPIEPIGRLEPEALQEASGLVRSRRHPGVFWTHNDSGHASTLFAVRRDGSAIGEFAVAAPNVDWEDIALDDRGRLYLGDIGNNGRRLPIRAIYRLDEPGPDRTAEAGPLPVSAATFYRFPADGRFDAEGLWIEGDHALLVAKYLDGREAELFEVPLEPPAPLFRPALPTRVGALPGFREPATGADLSEDGRRLAVCGTDVARVYERPDQSGHAWTLIGTVRYRADQVEAICWDGADLILAGEGRGVYRIAERTWRGLP